MTQETRFAFRVVLVNDGCPDPETEAVCRAYTRANPDRVLHVHRGHGGPSAARNEGVRLALSAWPCLRAVFFLDADDRLWPTFLQAAMDVLQEDAMAGWVFPNLALFGRHSHLGDMSGRYSILEHLADNYCAATSLVRREVFEAGVWFDEDLREGFEDWEFWLQAVEAGFRGRHLKSPPYRYRYRWESRNQAAGRAKAAILAIIRAKHPSLYTLQRFASLEARELPRYAVLLADEDRVVLTGDPCEEPESLDLEGFADRLWLWSAQPGADPVPPLVLCVRRPVLRALQRTGAARACAWWLQAAVDPGGIAALAIRTEMDTSLRFEWGTAPRGQLGGPGIIALRTALLRESLEEEGLGRLGALASPETAESARLFLAAPDLELPECPPVQRDLLDFCRRLRRTWRRLPGPCRATSPSEPRRALRDGLMLARSVFGVEAPLPLARHGRGPHVAFLLERTDGSDLERLVLGLGRESREQGFVPHLFVLGAEDARLPATVRRWADSVSVLPPRCSSSPEDLVSLVGVMDAVVAAQARPAYEVLGRLRRLAVRTVLLLGPSDPVNPPAADLAFEAQRLEDGLDGIVSFSPRLLARCLALGVPESKLASLPLPPGVAAATAVAAASPALKAGKVGPLRLLFLGPAGRADTEDLALRIRDSASSSGPSLDWRWPTDSYTEAERARDFSWADAVCVAPGFPSPRASVAEAQSFGCAFLAPAMELLGEMADEGTAGFLFPRSLRGEDLAQRVLACLSDLAGEPGRLAGMQTRARDLAASRSWAVSFGPLGRMLLASGTGL